MSTQLIFDEFELHESEESDIYHKLNCGIPDTITFKSQGDTVFSMNTRASILLLAKYFRYYNTKADGRLVADDAHIIRVVGINKTYIFEFLEETVNVYIEQGDRTDLVFGSDFLFEFLLYCMICTYACASYDMNVTYPDSKDYMRENESSDVVYEPYHHKGLMAGIKIKVKESADKYKELIFIDYNIIDMFIVLWMYFDNVRLGNDKKAEDMLTDGKIYFMEFINEEMNKDWFFPIPENTEFYYDVNTYDMVFKNDEIDIVVPRAYTFFDFFLRYMSAAVLVYDIGPEKKR